MNLFHSAYMAVGELPAPNFNMMNIGHSPMAEWGLKHIKINKNDISLDVGCGGGANIKKLLEKVQRVKFLALIIQRLVLENQKKLINLQ